MTETIKVHPGLAEVYHNKSYHLGHYAVDFQDGELRFQLLVNVCPLEGCPCDTLFIDWHAEGTVFQTRLMRDGQWRGAGDDPIPAEMEQVFRIVADTEMFRERFEHFLFLRHKQVLKEAGRLDTAFDIRLPKELLMPGADPRLQTLGSIRIKQPKGGRMQHGFCLEFCSDPSCYCENLIFVLGENEVSCVIEPEGSWQIAGEDRLTERTLTKARSQLAQDPRFEKLVAFLRTERVMQNYHRHVVGRKAQSG